MGGFYGGHFSLDYMKNSDCGCDFDFTENHTYLFFWVLGIGMIDIYVEGFLNVR